jgi:signal transduction histidine kinase
VPDTRRVPALWASWQRLRGQLGVDWDVLAFCTRDIRLPDGTFFGTLCIHHREPRVFSADEQGLLDVLARLLAQEVWRERAAARLRDALSELELAQQQRVELAEELRHELRAPLQVIDGYAEAMLDDVVARDDEHVVLVRREAGRAMRLLDDLVDLVRLEARADDAEQGPVDAGAVVEEMRARLAPLAEAAGVELEARTESSHVPLARKRLEQFVVNVVRNALRATQHGGGSRIALSVRREGELVAIAIEDDGPGMQERELDRAFERFFRGASARDAADGSGLGLTVARRIIEAAGGDVAIEPVDPHGLRLIARVPAAESGAGGDHAALEA